MANRSIGAKIASGCVLALVILIGFGTASYWSTDNFTKAAAMSEHTLVVQGELGSLLSALQDAETGQRGYLIVGEEPYLAPYHKGASALDENLKTLRRLTADNPSQQQMVGMDQVALAMNNIKQVSSQNVVGTRQAEVAVQGLHELGVQLGALIGRTAA